MRGRHVAAQLADATCPRCGAGRAADQTHCLECGLRLPVVIGPLAAWRRRWVRSLGWYPGDWVWGALGACLVAIAGAAAAITFDRGHRAAAAVSTYVAASPRLAIPTLHTAPNGRTVWPTGLDGWTVVLESSPGPRGNAEPRRFAVHAARAGLPQVGVLESSTYPSLHPGYYVVFSGVYGIPGDAQTALTTIRSRGFPGAYVARVSP